MDLDRIIEAAVIYYGEVRDSDAAELRQAAAARRGADREFLEGLACYLERDFAGAERRFESAAAAQPEWLWPRLLSADSAYFNARFLDAEKRFVSIVRAFPRSAWAHALLGRARYLQGDKRMLHDLDRAIALEPEAGWIYAWRGAAKSLLGDRAGAERDYRAAVRLAADYERARSWYGAFLGAAGRTRESVRELTAARRLSASSEVTEYALSRALLKLGRAAEARTAFERAIRINRAAAWENGWSDVMHADRACEATLRDTEALLKKFPRWSAGWTWKGQTELRLKRYSDALESLSKGEKSAWNFVFLGESLRRLGDIRRAESAFTQAARLDPKCAWAWAGSGACRLYLGHYGEAASDLNRAISLSPRCGKGLAYLWRGEALLRLGRKAGRKDLETALSLHPNFPQARRWLGDERKHQPQGQGAGRKLESGPAEWTQLAIERLGKGDAAGAVEAASRAIEDGLDPTYLPGYEARAAARAAQGDLAAAFDDCRRILAMSPGHPRALAAARRLALDAAMFGPGEPRSRWRGLLVHGVMQNAQGTLRTAAQMAAEGERFTRQFGWQDATAPKTLPSADEAAAYLKPDSSEGLTLRALLGFQVRTPYVLPSAHAWRDLKVALEADPNNPWAHALAGLGHFFEQRLARAIGHFTRLTELRPDWAWAHLLRGVPRWYYSETEGSIDDFARALALDSDLPWAHLLLGRSKADHRASSGYKGDGGTADLDRAAELEPSGVVLGWRGCAHMGVRDFARAKQDFDGAIRAWPYYDRAYAWRGMMNLMAGKPRAALPDLKHCVRMNPSYPTAQYTLGRAYLELGRFRESMDAQRAGAERDRSYLWDWCWFDVSHPNPAARKSIQDLDILLAKFPKEAWGWAWRGQSRMLLRDYAGALQDLEHAITLDPRDPWALLWKGETLRRLGRWREALAPLSAALRLKPDMHWALTSRGGCRLQLGSYRDAVRDLDRALRLNPRSGRGLAHAWRGEALWRLGRKDAAMKDFDTALEFYPNWFWLKKWKQSLSGQKNPPSLGREGRERGSSSVRISDKWLSKHPFEITALVARAEARYKKGDYAGSIEDASRVLEMNMDPTHLGAACLRALARCDSGDVAGAKDELGRVEVLKAS